MSGSSSLPSDALIHRKGGIILTLIVPLDEAVPPPNQIDKDWLTTVLKRDGTLSAGGISDLSYLMVQYWDVEMRRELEMSVLREYHRQLLVNGVIGYDWDQLFADYKLCAVQAVYTVAEWCIKAEDRERMRWLWRLELERAMHAFFDLVGAP